MDNETPLLHVATLTQFEASIGGERILHHLAMLSDSIATLLASLHENRHSAEPELSARLAHVVVGDAGLLGFVALSTAACRFIAAVEHEADSVADAAITLRAVAGESQNLLRQRIESLRRALVHATNPL